MYTQKLFQLFVMMFLIVATGCTAMRDKLSKSEWGNGTLKSYDWSVSKVQLGFDYTREKATDLLNKADQDWLDNMIGSIGVHVDESDAVPAKFSGQIIWPVKAGKGVALTSLYGSRWGKKHRGIDLGAPTGTPVYAIASGKVLYAKDGKNGFGKLIIIQHKGIISSYYAHNSRLKVKKGTKVRQGQLISLIGSTGRSTGPHLHFEIRHGRNSLDPCDRLPQHLTFEC